MKPIFTLLTFLGLVLFHLGAHAQNISISGSCTQSVAALVPGADPLLTSMNGRPVYYNASVPVNYAATNLNAEAYLYFELAANLGTPEDRWVIAFDGQPYYYFISASLIAPTGTYLPFDPMEPVSMCGGSVIASSSFPLNVALKSFSAIAASDINSISWTTTAEVNNDYFDVERSSDGLVFDVLGKIQSKADLGTSATELSYTFEDVKPLPNRSYYRLTQTDLDGKHQVVSAVIEVLRMNGFEISVYPNPVVDELRVSTQAGQTTSIRYEIRDVTGQTISSGRLQPMASGINFTQLPKGLYVVLLHYDNMDSHVFKIYKQ